jgi:hypothetical protein
LECGERLKDDGDCRAAGPPSMWLRVRFAGDAQSTVLFSVRLQAQGARHCFKPLPNSRCAQVPWIGCLDAQFKLISGGSHLPKVIFHQAQDLMCSAFPINAETQMKRLQQLLFSAFILTRFKIGMAKIVANDTLPYFRRMGPLEKRLRL